MFYLIDADRLVTLTASKEEMAIHRILQGKAYSVAASASFDLGEESTAAASATFPAVTMGHTLRKARGDPSFLLDKGEMGPRPKDWVYWKQEGRRLVPVKRWKNLTTEQKKAAIKERTRRKWDFSEEEWMALKEAVRLWKATGKPTAKMQYVQDLLMKHKDRPPAQRPIFMIASEGRNFQDVLEAWLKEQGLVKGNKPGKEVKEAQTYLTYFASDSKPARKSALKLLREAAQARQDGDERYRPLCILVNTGAADTGLNLQGASHTILVDLPWTWAKVLQLEGRTERIGQAATIVFKILVTNFTVDMPMWKLVVTKRELGENVKMTPKGHMDMLRFGLEDKPVTIIDSDDDE